MRIQAMKQIDVITRQSAEVIDVTGQVGGMLAGGGDGLAIVSIPHTTAALVLSEDDEELRRDLIRVARRWLEHCGPFEHRKKNNPNTAAHVLSAFGGTSLLLAVAGGRLELGEYQRILLLELDGPKTRTIRLRQLG